MQFPTALRVRVNPGYRHDIRVDQLLVGLVLRHRARDYYSTLLGLTNVRGELEVGGEELRRRYLQDQRLFPMDYKLSLETLDETAIVGLGGGRDFEASRATALQAPLLDPSYREWWRAAQNQEVAEDETTIACNGTPVEAVLTARRIGLS